MANEKHPWPKELRQGRPLKGTKNLNMIKYKHALALNPYFGDSTALIGAFPPTGLEYIVASIGMRVPTRTRRCSVSSLGMKSIFYA
jgi:hypothetical protein